MKILLGDFNTKVPRKNTLKMTIGNESLHQDSNDAGIRVVNFEHKKSRCQEHNVPTPKFL